MRVFVTFVLLFACASAAYSQPTIISVVPNTVTSGQKLSIAVAGLNTHFIEQNTTLALGDGIRVLSVTVNRPNLLTATIEVDPAAASGPRTARVMVALGNEVAELFNALTVISPGGDLRIAVTIIPVQQLRISDFDPSNKASAPLIFNATIFNDQVERNSTLKIAVTHERHGLVTTGTKSLGTLPAGVVRVVNNKEIDEFLINPSAKPFFSNAMVTGLLPAGTYTYRATLHDERGNILVENVASSVLTNPSPVITLISPGTTVGSPMDTIASTEYTGFLWTSSLSSAFKVTVFEVREGQTSPEDIARNNPVYQSLNVYETFHLFPSSANLFEPQKIYAWHVTGQTKGDFRDPTVKSNMLWFVPRSFGMTRAPMLGARPQEERYSIKPKEAEIFCGETVRFALLSNRGKPIPTKIVVNSEGQTGNENASAIKDRYTISWRILPADAGEIDENGVFTAGARAGTIAVIARFTTFPNGESNIGVPMEDYATVTISPRIEFDVLKLFMEMFGTQSEIQNNENPR